MPTSICPKLKLVPLAARAPDGELFELWFEGGVLAPDNPTHPESVSGTTRLRRKANNTKGLRFLSLLSCPFEVVLYERELVPDRGVASVRAGGFIARTA